MRIAITGANSSVGLKLLDHLDRETDHSALAGVRSESARQLLPDSAQIEPCIISYADPEALASSLSGADCVVHLAGILIEDRQRSYENANVRATAAVVEATKLLGARHLVFISVLGADPGSPNAYFRSKGQAEDIVRRSGLSASIIRTPLLLGPGTAGAAALIAAASKAKTMSLGGGHYTLRPLDIDDLNLAILRCAERCEDGAVSFELAGAEALSYRALIERTAAMLGNNVKIGSVPVWLARLGAAIGSRLKGGGISPTVVDVITRDEVVSANADSALDIALTPLEHTLGKIVAAGDNS